ncbi:MAG: NAD(P)/FAD-dependent oxidoreductase [Lachnospiraceae bacterium]|nr:NAD(P)/FAD-dependent oxidoreductase [Lachnospiraceae bacterium]
MSKVAVIGGGAAGMMAAAAAAQNGHQVSLYEKNEKLGKKIFITGKGRCNLTNDCEVEELLEAVCVNRKFLYSAFYGFTSQDTIAFFEEQGMRTKTERGNRVFPASDHSSDVIRALSDKMKKCGVKVHLNTEVEAVLSDHEGEDSDRRRICAIRLKDGREISADAVIVATGGISYRSTGSTGDGYRFAEETGHSVTELSPSLVPIETQGNWASRMQGLSLRNVEVTVLDGKKEIYSGFGEMMFTHFGVTGPLILTASSQIQKKLAVHPLQMYIDLKPALSSEQLDARILREFEAAKNKQFKNVIGALFPAKLIPVMIERSGIPAEKAVHDISREERHALVTITKQFPLTLTRLRDYNEAVITRGGVSVKEINPATMESKKVSGLYFAGEVLDLDAVTGGFNLQIAWSTGYAAGSSVLQI